MSRRVPDVESAARRPSLRQRVASIRMRVVVGYVVLVTVTLAISVLVTRQVLLVRLDGAIDRALVQETEELRLLAEGVDPATAEPFGADVRALFDTFLRRSVPDDNEAYYTFVDGQPSLSSFAAPLELLDDADLVASWAGAREPTRVDVTTELGEVRSLAVPLLLNDDVAGTFVVAFFPEPERNEVFVAVRVIALTGLVVLTLSAITAWSLAGRVLRPVGRMAETAHRVNEADLSGRIRVEGHDELAQLGHTLNDMLDRLEHGFAGQRQFLDDVAHELRTPITIAQGHLDLLEHDPENADLDETVEIVRDELDRMSRYVSDLLVLAKAERPDFLRPEPTDLGELLESVLQRVTGLGPRTWVVDAGPPPGLVAVVADSGRLEQALLNLAGNAVQHTDDGDEIAIGAALVADIEHPGDPARTNSQGRLELWVRDTGPGIDPGIIDTLFRRSVRGASSRAARSEGMGIGLSIVDAIARAHGGSVAVHSRPGHGATFTISIPQHDHDDDHDHRDDHDHDHDHHDEDSPA